ncbi:YbjN domain-containing protein [Sulfurimonas diazotrophicus]|uniref:YbjN domain-containing protein n=1 Tax=Sulfurimonas diazotrophicus TaxID=3131939 RepID=A0ABZ3HC00_9BACT
MALSLLTACVFMPNIQLLHAEDLLWAEGAKAIESMAKGFGSATLKTSSNGAPYIIGRIDGTKYGIYFYGCEDDGSACKSIQFTVGWSEAKMTMETINRWNRDTRFGKAYLDEEGDPCLEMDVNLDYGVTSRNVEDSFDLWTRALKSFKTDYLD